MNARILITLFVSLAMVGCVHLGSVSTSSIPVDRTKAVEVEASRFFFFFFNFDNDYVDALAADLARQCPDGKVEGILTKLEGITYLPLILHAARVTASGFCVAQSSPVAAPPAVAPATEAE